MASGNCNTPQLFLASNSPRRKELLALTGLKYGILCPQVDETPKSGEDGVAYVKRITKSKIDAAANQASKDSVIIAADTSVIDSWMSGETKILGKPCDRDEAREMLITLSGHTHQVHTAISILCKQDNALLSDLCTTHVPMRNYSNEEIDAYVTSGDPMDKAGGYAIQHPGFHPVEKLEGCYANVMGLPLCHLTRTLHRFGIIPPADVPQACQSALGYNCPVYAQILSEKALDNPCG
jgi:MAF protein